jgi:hypothetical protein
MRIGRLEFGIATCAGWPDYKSKLFEAYKACCQCYMIDVWIFYITWLGDECYYVCRDPECACHEDGYPDR